MGKKNKQAFASVQPSGTKEPKVASESSAYDERKAAWRVGKIQMSDPYGWHNLTAYEAGQIRVKLSTFEGNTWREIFVRDARWNHRIASGDLRCPIARAWMAKHMKDQPYLWTLRLSNTERVWGVLSEGAYQVIFWDPEHRIWEITR